MSEERKRTQWGDIANVPRARGRRKMDIIVWKVTIRLVSKGKKDRVFHYYYDNHTRERAEVLAGRDHLPGLLKRYPSYRFLSTNSKSLSGNELEDYMVNTMGQKKLL